MLRCEWDSSDEELPQGAAQPGAKRHACDHDGCGATFSRRDRLRAHLDLHRGEKRFKCTVDSCEKSYTNNSHLKRHVAKAHANCSYVRVFICQQAGCHRQLSSEWNLRRHYRQAHDKPFKCKTCDACFNKHKKLAAHEAIHSGIYPFKCEKCEVRCATEYQLKRHARRHKTYCCPRPGCENVCDTWTQLRKHCKLDHPPQYVCSICSKVFTDKCSLKLHMAVHVHPVDREVMQCPYDRCPRFYFRKSSLVHHIKSSHEGKKFACDHPGCERTFCTKQKMQDHKKLHDPGSRLPRRRCKSRKKRKDVGRPKRSIAAKLSGASVPYHVEKDIVNRTGTLEDQFVVVEVAEKPRGVEECASHLVEVNCLESATEMCNVRRCPDEQPEDADKMKDNENFSAEVDSLMVPESDPRGSSMTGADSPASLDTRNSSRRCTGSSFHRRSLPGACGGPAPTNYDNESDANSQRPLRCSVPCAQDTSTAKSSAKGATQKEPLSAVMADADGKRHEPVAGQTVPRLSEQAATCGESDVASPDTSTCGREPVGDSEVQLASGCHVTNGDRTVNMQVSQDSSVLPRRSLDRCGTGANAMVTTEGHAVVDRSSSWTTDAEADSTTGKDENLVAPATSAAFERAGTVESEDLGACVSSTVVVPDAKGAARPGMCGFGSQAGGHEDLRGRVVCAVNVAGKRTGSARGGLVGGSVRESVSRAGCAGQPLRRRKRRCNTSRHEIACGCSHQNGVLVVNNGGNVDQECARHKGDVAAPEVVLDRQHSPVAVRNAAGHEAGGS